MTKPWDIKDLSKRLQKAGLPLLEDSAIIVINEMLDWVQESITGSESKMDDFALMALPVVRNYALKLADQIADKEKPDQPDQAAHHPIQALPTA